MCLKDPGSREHAMLRSNEMITSTTVKLLPKSCCSAALAFLQKGQYLNEPAVISDGDSEHKSYERPCCMWHAYTYDLEKMTTFSLLTSPSTNDLGSDPPMLGDEVLADSVLLEPNNPM